MSIHEDSICVDAGQELEYEKDFYGNSIIGNIDIGAFEYVP
jgi:hypothetical protein